MKVWIVLEGPEMTYYGDAEIHGVFMDEEAAKARALKIAPQWPYTFSDRIRVGEYEVEPGRAECLAPEVPDPGTAQATEQ